MKKPKIGKSNARMTRLSITTKIAVAFSLLIMFLVSVVAASIVLKNQALFKAEFQEKGWSIVYTALPYFSSYMQSNNLDYMNNIVKAIGKYQDISYVAVLDEWGKVLVHTDDKQVGTWFGDEDTKSVMAEKSDILKLHSDDSGKPYLMDFYAPIKTAGGGTIGYFRLGVSLAGLTMQTRQTTINIILICLAAIIAGIFLSQLITKRTLKKPLLDLTAATEKLAIGDFSYKVNIYSQDELGDLARSFNTMTVHLSNLVHSVKSSVIDINKSAEQIIGQLQTSGRTNNKLSQTFDLLKQGTEEQVAILKQSSSLAEQLSEQSKNAMDGILQILSEVKKTVQVSEKGVNDISRVGDNIQQSGRSLAGTRNLIRQVDEKARQFSQTIADFSELLKKTNSCTVQVALEAARSGNEELARAAETLHAISEESAQRVSQMSSELADVDNTWSAAEKAMDSNIKSLSEGQEAVTEAGDSLGKVMRSLLQSKDFIEAVASSAQQQSANIEDIIRSQSGIINGLLKSIKKSSGAGSDTKVQMENLHDIDSLTKKLIRMVDRLNVLSLQFKTQ
ncbi:Methyl-accepting chemotaxis protein McpB [Pelotomaculum sp. FP]|uniref:methyl-accepting chemotaxis protein n=1 Tax=Pelotomaculum sp. FP TaxID=261474 RepID=UPI001066CCB4|nr:methyl-accepting chemotaxis protein [Pelotomaculum sp. FP]TEB16853.1 Methyl-accepting chemotaxis protein McpB [Pelotomaculum sp. FP]